MDQLRASTENRILTKRNIIWRISYKGIRKLKKQVREGKTSQKLAITRGPLLSQGLRDMEGRCFHIPGAGMPIRSWNLESFATGAPVGAETTMQAAWWDLDYRGNAGIASDTPEVEREGWVWDNLASPLFPCHLPPITEEKQPMAKSKWKPVCHWAQEILFAGPSPPPIPLYPMIKKKAGEGQGINLKINRFP